MTKVADRATDCAVLRSIFRGFVAKARHREEARVLFDVGTEG